MLHKAKYLLAAVSCWLLLVQGFAQAQVGPTGEELANAQTCGSTNLPSYSALVPITETYDLYLKLGKAGQKAKATIYTQPLLEGSCQKLATLTATADSWQKVGSLRSAGQDSLTSIILNSDGLGGLPNANRPTILLVSRKHPACQPRRECSVRIGEAQGILRGLSTLNNQDSLRVVKVASLSGDTITRVDYYVDGRAMYSRPTLEPFDVRFVSSGKHTLSRVVSYASKQQAVLSETKEGSFNDLYPLFMFYRAHRLELVLLAIVLGVWILGALLLSLAHNLYQRHLWKVTHIVRQKPQSIAQASANRPAVPHFTHPDSLFRVVLRRGALIVGVLSVTITVILTLNTFVIQLFTVDGPSMQVTLHTGERLLVNKLGKSWTSLRRSAYVPKRGEIVVVRKQVQSDLLTVASEEEQTFVVKRVFGLPGERIMIKQGKVTIYNQQSPKGFDPEKDQSWYGNVQKSKLDDIDLTLGPGELFVIGDNRPESIDSREYGAVKTDNVVGNVTFRLAPLSKFKHF